MQNPLAMAGLAWWRPPAGEKAWAGSPASTAAAAATVAPHTSVAASCMPGKGGLSPGASPYSTADAPDSLAALTAAR
jgi:hypothetical protein